MMNDRPIEDEYLQRALNECKTILTRYGLAGAVMLVNSKEAAFFYGMHAPWSAIRADPTTPLGFRVTAKSAVEGKEAAHDRITGAMHTICTLCDFGEQTAFWMTDLKRMMQAAGVDFQHTPHGGQPLQHVFSQRATQK